MDDTYQIGYEAYANGYGRNDYPKHYTQRRIDDWQRGWNAACYEIGELE